MKIVAPAALFLAVAAVLAIAVGQVQPDLIPGPAGASGVTGQSGAQGAAGQQPVLSGFNAQCPSNNSISISADADGQKLICVPISNQDVRLLGTTDGVVTTVGRVAPVTAPSAVTLVTGPPSGSAVYLESSGPAALVAFGTVNLATVAVRTPFRWVSNTCGQSAGSCAAFAQCGANERFLGGVCQANREDADFDERCPSTDGTACVTSPSDVANGMRCHGPLSNIGIFTNTAYAACLRVAP